MKWFSIALAFVLSAPAAATAACPAYDRDAQMEMLKTHYDRLAAASNERVARVESSAIWDVWTQAPDDRAQRLLDEGVRKMGQANFDGAETLLSQLIAYCPDYPEGWNQRAFSRYLAGDLDGALADLDEALALNPAHFAALSGRGLTLLRQGRTVLGHAAIREAVRYHPFLNERHLLPPDQKI